MKTAGWSAAALARTKRMPTLDRYLRELKTRRLSRKERRRLQHEHASIVTALVKPGEQIRET